MGTGALLYHTMPAQNGWRQRDEPTSASIHQALTVRLPSPPSTHFLPLMCGQITPQRHLHCLPLAPERVEAAQRNHGRVHPPDAQRDCGPQFRSHPVAMLASSFTLCGGVNHCQTRCPYVLHCMTTYSEPVFYLLYISISDLKCAHGPTVDRFQPVVVRSKHRT